MKKVIATGTKNKKAVVATAITTILSATAAVVAIKKTKKADLTKEDKSEVEIVLDGLVEDGTITQAQQDAIQSAIMTAKEATTAKEVLTIEEDVEATAVPDSSKTSTLTKITNSIFKGPENKTL